MIILFMLFSPSSKRKAPFTCGITRSSRKSDWSSLLCLTVCLVLKSHTHTRSIPLLLPTSGAVNRPHRETLFLEVILSPLPDHPKHRRTFCHSEGNNRAFVSMVGLASDSTHTSATWPEPGVISGRKTCGFSFKSSPCHAEDSFYWSREFPRPFPW